MARSSSGPGRNILNVEITGSTPVRATKFRVRLFRTNVRKDGGPGRNILNVEITGFKCL